MAPGAGPVQGRVELIEALGADTLIYVEALGVSVVARQNMRTELVAGDAVSIEFDQHFLHVFGPDGKVIAETK
jgi:multiple sugar transport system ATP-binding protein